MQAALWVAELHSPDRDASLEEPVRRWLAEDPRHAAAFELATDAWQRSGNLPANLETKPDRRRRHRRLLAPALAGAAVLSGLLLASAFYLSYPRIQTSAGEQRTVGLPDGTQLTLNARTEVRLHFDAKLRQVTLSRGEALFRVAKEPARPFVVHAGNRKVIALGTEFMVRREGEGGQAFAVTLLEGRVAVEESGASIPASWSLPTEQTTKAPPNRAAIGTSSKPVILAPGERLKFAQEAPDVLDAPAIDKLTAWQRGLLIFDDVSLSEAAAEFNRYGAIRIVLRGKAAERRVGGVFRIADAASFAQSMASAYGLHMVSREDEIELNG